MMLSCFDREWTSSLPERDFRPSQEYISQNGVKYPIMLNQGKRRLITI